METFRRNLGIFSRCAVHQAFKESSTKDVTDSSLILRRKLNSNVFVFKKEEMY